MSDAELEQKCKEAAEWLAFATTRLFEVLSRDFERGADVEIAIVTRGAGGEIDPDDPHWSFMRTFAGADELEDFLRAAATTVSLWPLDDSHVEHDPVDVTALR